MRTDEGLRGDPGIGGSTQPSCSRSALGGSRLASHHAKAASHAHRAPLRAPTPRLEKQRGCRATCGDVPAQASRATPREPGSTSRGSKGTAAGRTGKRRTSGAGRGWSDWPLRDIQAKEKKLGNETGYQIPPNCKEFVCAGQPHARIPEPSALNLYLNDALTTINVQFAVKLERLTITQPVRNSFKHLRFSGCTSLKTLTIRTMGEQAQDLSWLARLEHPQPSSGHDPAASMFTDLSLSTLRRDTPNHRQLVDRDMRTLAEFGLLNGNGAVRNPYTLNLAGHQISLYGLAFLLDALSSLAFDKDDRLASHRSLRCIDVRGTH